MNKSVFFADFTIVSAHDNAPVSILKHGYCSVSGNRIVYVGNSRKDAETALSDTEYEVYNGENKILCPTFANAHGHSPMSIFRNIADDTSLQDWLFGEILPREDKMLPDDFYYGNLLTLSEMISSGTGCCANMYSGTLMITKGCEEAGFRMQQSCDGKTCIDGTWSVDHDNVRQLLDFIKENPSGLITPSIIVHSVYLYPGDFYPVISDFVNEYKIPVTVHISETIRENEDCMKAYGCTPVKFLDRNGLLKDTTVAAHCVHLTEEDMKILSDRKVWVAHNPSSNMKLASGVADMVNMQKAGIRLCIGSDGAASNNNQDMFTEMRLSSFLAKGTTFDPTVMNANDVFTMATRNGYLACGFEDCGIIEKGMKADLQIIDYDCPQMWPLGNPLSALVYSCDKSCVESVMIDGKFVYRNRELLTIDFEKVKAETKKIMQRLK